MRTYDLTPLYRTSVGFDRLRDMFDTAFRGDENGVSYPPYNIEKRSEDHYRIVMAVAGFKDADLTITAQQNTLTVAGRVQHAESEGDGSTYLHKGIANRSFERTFSLADYVKVGSASLADGLLTIELTREIPEQVKPRQIAINGKATIEVAKQPKAA